MKKLKNIFNAKSLRYQLLTRFFVILVFLLAAIEVYQYINLKQFLCNSKVQLLQSHFHNAEMKNLVNIQTQEEVYTNAPYIISNVVDINTSAAVIDENGTIAEGSTNVNDNHNPKTDPKPEESDKSTHAEKDRIPIPIPKFSKDDYRKILEQNGSLERSYSLVKDDNKNLQLVIWRKIGDVYSPVGLVQLSTSAKDIQDILDRQLYVYIGASVLILIIGGILGIAVFNRTLRPLYSMTNTVEQIGVEQLDKRLNVNNGQLEVDMLSNAFNNMLKRIEASFEKEQYIKEKMRQFVSDASHELRTPLTSIHGFVEVLLRGAAKNEKQLNLALNSILIESERLTKLVNDLLLLTRLDQQVVVEKKTESINDIIQEIYPQLQILSKERKIELHLQPDLYVHANRNQIKQVIFNLVQNAVHHTDENKGIITITTNSMKEFSDAFVVLEVIDNGTGIPKEHINDIFDRFFRSESHRSRKQGGYGLGLSIVKSIIDAHEGKLKVTSELGKGTTFTIYLRQII